jgi:hypothetical protein
MVDIVISLFWPKETRVQALSKIVIVADYFGYLIGRLVRMRSI